MVSLFGRGVKKISVKRMAWLLLFASATNGAMAGYIEGHDLSRMYVGSDGFAYFGTSTQPPSTCHYFGEYFRFDAKSEAGKAMLSILLSAKMVQKKIIVWYYDSTTAGTDHNSGCSAASMAQVSGVGVKQ